MRRSAKRAVGLLAAALVASLGGCARRLEALHPREYVGGCEGGTNTPRYAACIDDEVALGPGILARSERTLLRWITRRYGGTELTSAQLFDLAAELYAPCPAPREPTSWSCKARLRIGVGPHGFFTGQEHRTVLVDFLAMPKDGRWQVTQAKVSVPGRPS